MIENLERTPTCPPFATFTKSDARSNMSGFVVWNWYINRELPLLFNTQTSFSSPKPSHKLSMCVCIRVELHPKFDERVECSKSRSQSTDVFALLWTLHIKTP
jgi:hypothetical protein